MIIFGSKPQADARPTGLSLTSFALGIYRLRYWLYGLVIMTAMGIAIAYQRGYQDSWVLEDIWIFPVLITIIFMALALDEKRPGRLALLSSVFVIASRLIPALKYQFVYGTAVDQQLHLVSVRNIMETGFPLAETVYSEIPGLHIILSLLATTSGTSAEAILKYGYPLIFGLFPLLIFTLCRRFHLGHDLIRWILIVSAFAFDPSILAIVGTSYGALLVMLLLVLFLVREYSPPWESIGITIMMLCAEFALVFSHAVSALAMAVMIAGSILIALLNRKFKLIHLRPDFVQRTLRLLTLHLVVFLGWWLLKAEFVFTRFALTLADALRADFNKAPIPSRIFELPISDRIVVFWSLYGNTTLLMILTGVGLVALYLNRQRIAQAWRGLLFLLIICLMLITVVGVQVLTGFGDVEIYRFLGYAVLISPVFAGAGLWFLYNYLSQSLPGRVVFVGLLMALPVLSFMQAYPYQPALPEGRALGLDYAQDEPVVYLHTVVTTYQQRMLEFAQQHIPENSLIAADRTTTDEAGVFWDYPYFVENRPRLVARGTPLYDGNWTILLGHRPGIAGPFTETLEQRNRQEIEAMLKNPAWSVYYDNGESFILGRR